MDERLVTIRSYSRAWEANVERMVLEEEGISTYLSDSETVTMNWLYSNAIGGVKLQVPESDVEEAQRILSETEEESMRLQKENGEECACPECGSSETRCEQKGRRWFYLPILLLGFPVYWPSQQYRCRNCGETWEKDEK